MKKEKVILSIIFSLFSLSIIGQQTAVNANMVEEIIDLIPFCSYTELDRGTINPNTLNHSSFQAITEGYLKVNPSKQYALNFSLKNDTNDSLDCIIYCSRISYGNLYQKKNNNYKYIASAGEFILRLNEFGNEGKFLRFKIPPQTSKAYIFTFYPRGRKRVKFHLWDKAQFDFNFSAANTSKARFDLFGTIFNIIVLFVALLATIFHSINRIAGLKYYALYLFTVLLMYIRTDSRFFTIFGELKEEIYFFWQHTESLVGYLMVLFYLLFVTKFLDFKQYLPKSNKVCSSLIKVYSTLVFVDILLNLAGYYYLAFSIFNWIKLFTLPIFLFIIFSVLRNYKLVLFRYVFIGTLIFIIPYLFSLIREMGWLIQGESTFLYKNYIWKGIEFPMYRPTVGILIEIFCFSAGLAYLYSKNLKDKETLAQRLAEKEQLLQKAAQTTSKSPKSSSKNKISLPSLQGYEIIYLDDILFCSAYENKCKIYFKNAKPKEFTKTLKEVNALLPASQFMRIHNSHTVNLNAIIRYVPGDGGYVILRNEEQLKVARSKKEAVLKWLEKH